MAVRIFAPSEQQMERRSRASIVNFNAKTMFCGCPVRIWAQAIAFLHTITSLVILFYCWIRSLSMTVDKRTILASFLNFMFATFLFIGIFLKETGLLLLWLMVTGIGIIVNIVFLILLICMLLFHDNKLVFLSIFLALLVPLGLTYFCFRIVCIYSSELNQHREQEILQLPSPHLNIRSQSNIEQTNIENTTDIDPNDKATSKKPELLQLGVHMLETSLSVPGLPFESALPGFDSEVESEGLPIPTPTPTPEPTPVPTKKCDKDEFQV